MATLTLDNQGVTIEHTQTLMRGDGERVSVPTTERHTVAEWSALVASVCVDGACWELTFKRVPRPGCLENRVERGRVP